jgi:hypothetical protein
MPKSETIVEEIRISAPNFKVGAFTIEGIAPLVGNKFSEDSKRKMMEKMLRGRRTIKGQERAPRDFGADYENSTHFSREGWAGLPATAFRSAMISACRLVGFKMTISKLAIFIEPDGFDKTDGTPLVKIIGERHRTDMPMPNERGGCDIRVRPMWDSWRIRLRIRYDADLFSLTDITNLLMRVGLQVGVGPGRPDSKNSAGCQWGMFKIINEK